MYDERICFEICRSIPVGTNVLAYDDEGQLGPAFITANESNTITVTAAHRKRKISLNIVLTIFLRIIRD
jgi:hypothetical protein